MARTKTTVRPHYKSGFLDDLEELVQLYKARGDTKQAGVLQVAVQNILSYGGPDELTKDSPKLYSKVEGVSKFVIGLMKEYLATRGLKLIYMLTVDADGFSGSFKVAVREYFKKQKFDAAASISKRHKVCRRGICCVLKSGVLARRSVVINVAGVRATYDDVFDGRWELFRKVQDNQDGFIDKLTSYTPRFSGYKEFIFEGEEHTKSRICKWSVTFTSAEDFNPLFTTMPIPNSRKPSKIRYVSGEKDLVWELVEPLVKRYLK